MGSRLLRRKLVSIVTGVLLLMSCGFAVLSSRAVAAEPLGSTWPAAQLVLMDQIDHGAFNALLHKYVDDDGYVNYAAWQRTPTDRKALGDYLTRLSRASTSARASRNAQLAFWINAYNAVTLEGILQVYPTSSIRNHTAKLFGYNIWKDLPLLVGGHPYSLEQIEHQVLRKMNEPRIHFAIVCASVGCPRLRNEAYTADHLEEQLADNARDFFRRPKNFRVGREGTLYVSSILDWFGSDFGRTQAERFAYLKPYLPPSAQSIALDPNTAIQYIDYDWSLNDQARRANGSAGRQQSTRGR